MKLPSNIDARPFDGSSVWATLTPAQQAEIGAAALELAVARGVYERAGIDPAERAAIMAERLALEALQQAALGVDGIRDAEWVETGIEQDRYRLPSVLGPVCTSCGCSQEDGCADGCGWAKPGLCTACANAKPVVRSDIDLFMPQPQTLTEASDFTGYYKVVDVQSESVMFVRGSSDAFRPDTVDGSPVTLRGCLVPYEQARVLTRVCP